LANKSSGEKTDRAVSEEDFSALLDAVASSRNSNDSLQLSDNEIQDKLALLSALGAVDGITYESTDEDLKKKIEEMSEEDFTKQLETYFRT
jgi:hypothetical protein